MEYAIDYLRDLNLEEERILTYILSKEKSKLLQDINRLKVIGRCGCGECLTVLFGYNIEDKIQPEQNLLFDYIGRTSINQVVGVLVFGNEIIISELEFYSPDGQIEPIEYPEINSLESINS